MGRSKLVLSVCCVCWKAWNGDPTLAPETDPWEALDTLVERQHLAPQDYELSHGYCPRCTLTLLQAFRAQSAERTAPFAQTDVSLPQPPAAGAGGGKAPPSMH